MISFVKGKKLSELFFKELIKPSLKKLYPNLKYSAGLLGPGSDVIGFDTERSMDHDWGPRILLFLSKKDINKKTEISKVFSRELPYEFRGFSTHFTPLDKKGVKVAKKINKGIIRHRIEIYSIEYFFKEYLHFDINKKISIYDWLIFPEHKLLTISEGNVFHDDLELNKKLARFKYYPRDVWLYLLECQWKRISQEEHFMGRCGELNDEIGSKIVATRLVKDIMRLCFLMERKYTPYIKWFGTGFSKLKSAKELKPILNKILRANNWKKREKYLSKAYEYLAKLHNSLKITKPLKTTVEQFHDRPFLVINGKLFAQEIKKQIKDKRIKAIKLEIGSINQFCDSTDVVESNTQKFKAVYR
ncbi:hypothetical protein COV18_04015 [Candidatus Woesearchaeota archaeon CG10_big_fil_rev_8_21_14_0_10_37_12]|nr:MAG: hypothetical protein COV18_04015 [Candidatus Woesearchaeota archaeon CG10_big_fil_rev_8_21_14_0_10_37_12]